MDVVDLLLVACVTGVLGVGVPSAAAAQENGSNDSVWVGVEEMIVTSNATAGLLDTSGVSVTAFDSDQLAAFGASDVSDISQFTPNLEIRTSGSTTPVLFIRGVGLNDFTANGAGAVAIVQDEVTLNLPAIQLGQFFDTEEVKILKGPQGSGPGRNASAGAILVTSRRPTGEVGAYLTAGTGNFGFLEIEGAVETPIVPDLLAVRTAFRIEKRNGLVTNRCGGFSAAELAEAEALGETVCGEVGDVVIEPGIAERLNDLNRWAARSIFRLQPGWLDSEWTLNLHGSRVDQLPTVGQAIGSSQVNGFGPITTAGYIVPEIQQERQEILRQAFVNEGLPAGGISNRRCRNRPGCPEARDRALASTADILAERLATGRPLDREPFAGDYNVDGHERQSTWGASLLGEMDIGDIRLTTITAFEAYDRSRIFDADYTSSTVFEFDVKDDAWQVSQDFRVEQELESIPVVWRAGAVVFAEDFSLEQLTKGSGDVPSIFQDYSQFTWAFNVYGEFDWIFTDDFELTAGVRYNWERKEFDIAEVTSPISRTNASINNACVGNENRRPADCDDVRTFSDPTGMVRLTYHLNADVDLYAKYTRGWKGAQYNASDGTVRGAFTLAKPETIDSVEMGFSGSWLDGRLSMNGAFFFYRYENYQVFLFANDVNAPPVRVVRNASSAQIYGAELEMVAEPLEGLVANFRFGWLESRFLDFSDKGTRVLVTGGLIDARSVFIDVPVDYTGNSLPNAPRFKISGSLEYEIPLGRAGSLTPRYDFTFTDDFSFDPSRNGRGAPGTFGDFFMPEFAIGQEAYVLHNARVTFSSPEGEFQVAGWVRNIEDLTYKTLAFDASATGGLVNNQVGDPRTYGLSVTLTY